MRAYKSILAIAVSLCLILGVVAMPVTAQDYPEDIGTVEFIDTITNGGSSYRDINNFAIRANNTSHVEPQVDGRADTHRMVFLTFDIADYVNNPSAVINSVGLQFYFRGIAASADAGGTSGQGTGGIVGGTPQAEDSPFGFYIMKKGHEPKDIPAGTQLHYAQINNLASSGIRLIDNGINDDPGARLASFRPQNPTSIKVIGAGGGDVQYSGDLWPVIKQHLAETGGTQFTIRMSLPKGYTPNSALTFNSRYRADMGTALMAERPMLRIDYIDDPVIADLNNAAASVTEASISAGQDLKNISANLNLPSTAGNGINISWASSDTSHADENGNVTRPSYSEANVPLTLEATFSYDAYSIKKSFNLTVLSDKKNPEHNDISGEPARELFASEGGYVKNGTGNDTSPMSGFGRQQLTGDSAANNQSVSFVKFDFTGKKNSLDAIDSTLLRLVPFNYLPLGGGQTASDNLNGASSTVKISLIDIADNWGADISYSTASAMLAGGTVLHTSTGVLSSNGYYTGNLLDEIKDYFAQNPSRNTITLRIEATSGMFSFCGPGALSNDLKPTLVSTSAQTAVDTAMANLNFGKISDEESTRLRKALDFASFDTELAGLGFYNTSVSWSVVSGAADVINTTTGAVTRKAHDVNVTLRAAVTSGSVSEIMDFPITVLGYDSDEAYFQSLLGEIVFDTTIVTSGFTLPKTIDNMVINWSSDDPKITIDNTTGNVTVERPRGGDLNINLTASISDSGTIGSKVFTFLVLRIPVYDALANMPISDESGDKEKAIDDDMNTFWTVDTDRIMTVNMGNEKIISQFLLVYDGSPASGVVIKASRDSYVWDTVYSGSVHPKVANYITPNVPVFAKFVRIELPVSVNAVRTFNGYSSQSGSGDGNSILSGLNIPTSVTADFALPQTVNGLQISYVSSNTAAVRIDGYMGRVSRVQETRRSVLTASVTDGITESYNYTVDVIGTGTSTGGSSSGGGGGSFSSYEVLNNPSEEETTAPPVGIFKDLSDAAWAENYIISLHERGIISGYPDGTFVPNGSLKRAEMSKLLSEGFGLPDGDYNVQFDDVNQNDWYYEYICKLHSSGITNGIGDNLFGIGLNISRQDAAVMLARLLSLRGIEIGADTHNLFGDDENIADYAKNGVYTLRSLNVIGGDDNGNFNPTANITRAEMSKIIYLSIEIFK